MIAVILAAGKSTRAEPLTVGRPKPLLKVANRPVLEHLLSCLQGIVQEAVIVVGFESSHIKEYFGSSFGKIRIKYVEQKSQLGTANALLSAKGEVKGRFLLVMGDDIYGNEDVKKCADEEFSILGAKVSDISSYGAIFSSGKYLEKIVEKPKSTDTNLANCGLYILDESIFEISEKLKKSPRGEFELTDALNEFCRQNKVSVVVSESWVPITYPWSLLKANEKILSLAKKNVLADVEKGVTIKGEVIAGKGTLLRAGTYIEGPVIIGENCDIGPNCYIRASTSIGNNCRIGNAVEVKNSIIMDNSRVGHLSYVGDSVIGENVNLGAGTCIANLRHDGKYIKSEIKGTLADSGLSKLGAFIGDGAKTGINTSIYPGRKIWPGKTTLPGEVVKKDVK